MNRAEVLIFVPREEEFEAIREVADSEFQNFTIRPVHSGPGKIHTGAAVAAEAAAKGPRPALIIGAGLCGSLDIHLKAGATVLSDSAALGDWLMEDDRGRSHGPYGGGSYKPLEEGHGPALAIKGTDSFVDELLRDLSSKGFQRGRLLTTDTLITGLAGKLKQGRLWGCLASDHESGALALVATERFPEVPWLNIRVVADTLGEQMGAAVQAVNCLEILALKLLVLLSKFDVNFPKGGCESCGGLCCPGLLPGKIR